MLPSISSPWFDDLKRLQTIDVLTRRRGFDLFSMIALLSKTKSAPHSTRGNRQDGRSAFINRPEHFGLDNTCGSDASKLVEKTVLRTLENYNMLFHEVDDLDASPDEHFFPQKVHQPEAAALSLDSGHVSHDIPLLIS
jgi:hypothetical protein